MATKSANSRRAKRAVYDDDDDSDVIPVVEPSGNFLTRLIFRPLPLLMLAIAAAAFVAGPQLARLVPDLSTRPEYHASAAQFRVTEPPAWVPETLVAQALERARIPQDVSLLDEDLVEKIAAAFRAHPWVEEVVGVRKGSSAGIEVELHYRKPVAMVRTAAGLFPVDAGGVLLPAADFSPGDVRRYPLIDNVRTIPRGGEGAAWGDPLVASAARLADVLGESWSRLELGSIYVPDAPAEPGAVLDPIFELRTPGGTRIIWGRAPGSGHPGELSPEQKIGRLEKYRADFGRFDQPHGPYEIDIRHWQEISRRPISAESGPPRR